MKMTAGINRGLSKQERLLAIAITVILLISMSMAAMLRTNVADASGDYQDEPYDFNLVLNSSDYSGERVKYNTSSVYMSVMSMTCPDFNVYTEGYHWVFVWQQWDDFTYQGSHGYVMDIGQTYDNPAHYEIWNEIVENNCSKMRLRGDRTSTAGIVNGVWSPDCQGSYTVINTW
ncbi:MAG: hypothetical protein IKE43_02390 [Coriobacteriales bacterium]|nr:hypothetical protein [Coriobacteriales bacterium]